MPAYAKHCGGEGERRHAGHVPIRWRLRRPTRETSTRTQRLTSSSHATAGSKAARPRPPPSNVSRWRYASRIVRLCCAGCPCWVPCCFIDIVRHASTVRTRFHRDCVLSRLPSDRQRCSLCCDGMAGAKGTVPVAAVRDELPRRSGPRGEGEDEAEGAGSGAGRRARGGSGRVVVGRAAETARRLGGVVAKAPQVEKRDGRLRDS